MTIYLTTTINDKDIVRAAGAKWDWEVKKWTIDESQKSNPVFSKYLPIDNKTISDLEPKPDLIDETESQIFGQMNSRIPNPFNHIKTYPTPEPEEEGSGDHSAPETLESVIEEIAPATSVSEQPTKRTRGQLVKQDNDQNKRSYVLNNESINELDRLAKYFKLNLSDTIQKLIKIGGQWIEENGKDAEIKMINNQNNQLIEAIEKTIAEQQREIDALKNALAKNCAPDVKNTSNQDLEKINKTQENQGKQISTLQEFMRKQSDWSSEYIKKINGGRIDRIENSLEEIIKYLGARSDTMAPLRDKWLSNKGGE